MAGIVDAAVVMQISPAGHSQLVAYVVSDQAPTKKEIRARLSERLPSYMVPSFVEYLNALPMATSGKVDRRRLPPITEDPIDDAIDSALSPTEQVVAHIWCDLLNRSSIGRDRDFFETGGDSLLAVRVCSRVQEQLGERIPLRWFFESPTIGTLASRIDASRQREAATLPEMQPHAPSDDFAQRLAAHFEDFFATKRESNGTESPM
jgi:hypothetical protein